MPSLITPVSCKDGVVILANQHIYGEEFAAELAIEEEEYKHFEMTADALGIIWKDDISSFAGGTAQVRAKWDNAVNQKLIQNKGIWLDATGTGWLGYTSLVGFIITYRILGARPTSNVQSPGSTMFDFTLRIRSCLPSITGP